MRHRRRNRSFNRPKGAREMLVRHLCRSLMMKGRIETTLPKAKEAGRLSDRLIQFGIRGDLASYRRAMKLSGSPQVASFIFKEIAPLYKKRRGGYTRILHNRIRPGDGVELATLELVEKKAESSKQKKEKKKALSSPATPKEETPPSKDVEPLQPKAREKEEKEKRGGFLTNLRKFIQPKDRS